MTFQMAGLLAGDRSSELGDLCPVERTGEIIGRRSTILLLREASYGTRRFDDFVRRTGLTESVVAAQLRALVAEGLFAKQPYREPSQRARSEYVLTDAGRELLPIIVALASWGDRHRPRSHAMRMVHAGCGANVETAIVCAEGHVVAEDEITVALQRTHDR